MIKIDFIRIDGVDLPINYVEPRQQLNGDKAWGMWHGDKNIIDICNVESEQRQIQVLLHEIIHNISYHRCHQIELSETQTQSIASGLMQVFMDNPGLLDIFRGEQAKDTK